MTSPIGSIQPSIASPLSRIEPPVLAKPPGPAALDRGAAPSAGFGELLEGALGAVQEKQDAAQAATRRVLMGESDQVHQSVIAMQEASVAFTMMVEVRNKLVESYQELMRMQV